MSVLPGTIFRAINTLQQLFEATNDCYLWIRSAATSGDASFNSSTLPTTSASNGWTQIHQAQDLTSFAIGPYFQICVTYSILTYASNTPAQMYDVSYTVMPPTEMSDYWEGGGANTTQSGASPAYTSFRLVNAYTSSVPTMYFRAYDDFGNLVASANTASNPTSFQYTTNNGTSWNALGTIPNTTLTTELRYIWATSPGESVTCSLRES